MKSEILASGSSEIRLTPSEIGSAEPAKLLPQAAVRNLGGRLPAGIYHVAIARFARSEERQSLSEEKLLRSLGEPVSGKPTPRLVGTRGARGEGEGGRRGACFKSAGKNR